MIKYNKHTFYENSNKSGKLSAEMPPNNRFPWSQADFIYDLKWGSQIHSDFIDYMAFEARVGKFVWPNKFNGSLMHGIDAINYNHSTEFSYVYGLKKLDLMEQRYKTFSWMLSLENVTYDASSNVVNAPHDMWKSIFEVQHLNCPFYASFSMLYCMLKHFFMIFNRKIHLLWHIIQRVRQNSKNLLSCSRHLWTMLCWCQLMVMTTKVKMASTKKGSCLWTRTTVILRKRQPWKQLLCIWI